MTNPRLIPVLIVIFGCFIAYSHGENKNGPHGGFIRMPGAFHTEVVPVGKNSVKVYLLDIDWKNPATAKSEVRAEVGKTLKVRCSPEADHFVCDLGAQFDLTKKGELKVLAVRDGQKGNEAIYELPLKLKAVEHSGH